MGARKKSAPRRGSMGVRPRKRASRIVPRVRSWPEVDLEEPKLLAFPGYKVGMTHVFMIDTRTNSPTKGMEIIRPVTIIEAPPIIPLAIRAYTIHPTRGLLVLSEAWANPPKELELKRKISTINEALDTEKMIRSIEERLSEVFDIRLIVSTQPKLVGGLSKKKPDLLEVKIAGGSIEERFNFAKSVLGSEVDVRKVFSPGMFIDVISVTKGKGFQGVVKRFGVKELPRHHKHRKGSRKIGARSPGIGALATTPQAGQMGFHRRTEYNKLILMIDDDPSKINPLGGWVRYGLIKSTYIVLDGSIPGPRKRLVVMRWPIRPSPYSIEEPPRITYISTYSKQGA